MDEATMSAQQMGDTEQIHAWAGEDISWAQPTESWAHRQGWGRRCLKSLVLAGLAVGGLLLAAHIAPLGAYSAARVVTVTPTAPPVPHPEQAPVDPYYTQSVSREEFLDSLRRNKLPIPDDAVKEANDICRLLGGGMPFRAVMINTSANHPDWTMVQSGGFTGAATGFCPKYSP